MKYFITLLISVTLLVGGVPQKISYQGYVTHSDGELVQDGNYNVKFRLFEAVEGGDALWEEEHTLYIGSGLISVVLGGITPLSFSESMNFLEIEINGEVLTPRQELTTVFYAFHSESAIKASTADFATTATKADTALYSTGIPTVSYNNLSDKPSIPSGIGDLSNVDLTNIASGKILKCDDTGSKFVVGDDVAGATDLSGLSDTDLTDVANDKILKYSGTSSKFVVSDDATGATDLSGLSDIDLTDVANGKILKYSSTSSKFVVSDDATASNTSSETFSITGTSTSAGTLKLYEDTDDGTNYVDLKPGTMSSDVTYTLPADDGNADQVLTTNGSGVLSWAAAGGDITTVGDATTGDVFTADGTGNELYFEGTSANTEEIKVVGANPGADVTVTIPATTGTLYISNGTDVAVVDGGTGTSTGSITGTGALTFAAGGTNQNVTLTPSGTGYTILNGNVGIGTNSHSEELEVNGAISTGGGGIRWKVFSGTLVEGDEVNFAHGLTAGNIIHVAGSFYYSEELKYYPFNYSDVQVYCQWDATNITVVDNTEGAGGDPYRVVVMYVD